MSRDERKRLLALACATDRRALVRSFVPSRRRPFGGLAQDLLAAAMQFESFIPGRAGRWLRTVSCFARIGQSLGLLRH